MLIQCSILWTTSTVTFCSRYFCKLTLTVAIGIGGGGGLRKLKLKNNISKTNQNQFGKFPNQTGFGLDFFPPQIQLKKFPNQTGFGLEICDNIFSFQTKLGLVWKIVTTFLESLFQTKLDLVWKRTLFKMQLLCNAVRQLTRP